MAHEDDRDGVGVAVLSGADHGDPTVSERLDELLEPPGWTLEIDLDGDPTTGGQRGPLVVDAEEVVAMAYDTPTSGHDAVNVVNLRLWSARATRDFDLGTFNAGNYVEAVQQKTSSETLSKVLYPNDQTAKGQELRLKQEYFFVSASLQDIVARFLKSHDDFQLLPDKATVQLNDTHPALGVAELMHILVDHHDLPWREAWEITRRCFNYTNHTLLPEALETWPIPMLQDVLPRHLEIIFDINEAFLGTVREQFPGEEDRVQRLSLVDDAANAIRMAHLAVVGSQHVNGVAELHTKLLTRHVFPDFSELWPDKFVNVTNGVTPRRWLRQANPELSALITDYLGGDRWITRLEDLAGLEGAVDDAAFRQRFQAIKHANKQRLATLIERRAGIEVPADAMFDVHVKRLHEYKRQLLNVLHIITRYNRIRRGEADVGPRVAIFAGKAAPGYFLAKLIINLINDVARVVNNDPAVGDRLKVAFIPNYNVSAAEVIMPGAELSEQVSTAGTEASGTGNMKFALNGALTVGTLDGANIEIKEAVGDDNIFIFGLTESQAEAVRAEGYDPHKPYEENGELREVIDMIAGGYFSDGDAERYRPLMDALFPGGDRYLVLADYASYVACQETVDAAYADAPAWLRRAILNVARMGSFSSDRTVHDYATRVWHAPAVCPVQ